jgi:hypothetical protein
MEGEDVSHSRWAPQPLSGSNNRIHGREHFADARAELSIRKHYYCRTSRPRQQRCRS